MQEIERQKQATTDSKAATSVDAMRKVQVCCVGGGVVCVQGHGVRRAKYM